MMSFTILYVEYTQAVMGQTRKKKLISLPLKKLENMRGGVGVHCLSFYNQIRATEHSERQ